MNQQTIDRQNIGKIVSGSMGCFLEPPLHPTYSYEVISKYNRGNYFSMSIDSATTCEWLDEETKKKAQDIMRTWKPLPIEDERVRDWILQVLGYFRDCYADMTKPANIRWNASELKIIKHTFPDMFSLRHAGVHHIRKYYPTYMPTREDFRQAYWRSKK